MAAAQIDQFTQALFGKVESVIIVSAILILVVGIPLYWLRLKLERTLIRVIRSARERRQVRKSAANTDSSQTVPHCPICNALDGKEACAARRAERFDLLGLQQLSEMPRHPSNLAQTFSKSVPRRKRRMNKGRRRGDV